MLRDGRAAAGSQQEKLSRGFARTCEPSTFNLQPSTLVYLAYPSSLTLRSANAVQTFNTIRELRALDPGVEALLPRLAWRERVFGAGGGRDLLRRPVNGVS